MKDMYKLECVYVSLDFKEIEGMVIYTESKFCCSYIENLLGKMGWSIVRSKIVDVVELKQYVDFDSLPPMLRPQAL